MARRYSQELKIEAVRRVVNDLRYPDEVADELGIARGTLRGWVRLHEQGKFAPTADPACGVLTFAEEMERLREENVRLEQEIAELRRKKGLSVRG